MDHQKISRAAVYQLILICLLLIPSRAGAQAADQAPATPHQDESLQLPRSSDPGRQPFIREFLQDEVHMWSSPFRRSSYSTRTFSRYVLPFTLITGALIATDHQTSDLLPNSPDQSKWSLRVSQIGAPYTLAGMAAGMYLISRATGNRKARETGFLGAAAIGHSQLLTLGLKYVTQRKRPLDYKAEGLGGTAFWRGGDSFPSGHSSGSFALATIFAYEYGQDHKWVPYASYGLASVVAASRLSGQKHWMSDLFVGGTMGFLVGRYVYKNHHDPRVDGGRRSVTERLIPQVSLGGSHVSLIWLFNE